MPTYEYKCTNDGSTFDLWQEVGSPAPPCPDCGAPTKKVFRPTRVIFKGSGFYVTDLRAENGGSKSDTTNKEAAAKSAATSSESSTETKVEAPKAEARAPKTDAPKAD